MPALPTTLFANSPTSDGVGYSFQGDPDHLQLMLTMAAHVLSGRSNKELDALFTAPKSAPMQIVLTQTPATMELSGRGGTLVDACTHICTYALSWGALQHG